VITVMRHVGPHPLRGDALPEEVRQRCLAFVHSYGLEYGALDLIVTPEGEYVFLETILLANFCTCSNWYLPCHCWKPWRTR